MHGPHSRVPRSAAVSLVHASSLVLVVLLSVASARAGAPPAPSPPEPRDQAAADDGRERVRRPIDLNTAGEEELRLLPRVGPVVARRIVEYRKAVGPFERVDELLNVKGIGARTLAGFRHLVTVQPPTDRSVARPGGGS